MSEHAERPYSVHEAAEILGRNPKTVYDAIRQKQLPSIRVGKRILVPRAAFDRLVREGA